MPIEISLHKNPESTINDVQIQQYNPKKHRFEMLLKDTVNRSEVVRIRANVNGRPDPTSLEIAASPHSDGARLIVTRKSADSEYLASAGRLSPARPSYKHPISHNAGAIELNLIPTQKTSRGPRRIARWGRLI